MRNISCCKKNIIKIYVLNFWCYCCFWIVCFAFVCMIERLKNPHKLSFFLNQCSDKIYSYSMVVNYLLRIIQIRRNHFYIVTVQCCPPHCCYRLFGKLNLQKMLIGTKCNQYVFYITVLQWWSLLTPLNSTFDRILLM